MFLLAMELTPQTWSRIGICTRVFTYLGPLTTAVLAVLGFVYKRTGEVKENSNRFVLNSAGRNYVAASIVIAVLTIAANFLKDQADSVARGEAGRAARAQLLQDLGGTLDSFAREKLGGAVADLSQNIAKSEGLLNAGISASESHLSEGIGGAVQTLNDSVATSADDITRRTSEEQRDSVTNSQPLQAVEFQVSTRGAIPNAPAWEGKRGDQSLYDVFDSRLRAASPRGIEWRMEIVRSCMKTVRDEVLKKQCEAALTMLHSYEASASFLNLLDPDGSRFVIVTLYTSNMSPALTTRSRPCHAMDSSARRCSELSDYVHEDVEFSTGCNKSFGEEGSRRLCLRESEKPNLTVQALGVAADAVPIKLQISTMGSGINLNYLPRKLWLDEELELRDGAKLFRSYVLKRSSFSPRSGYVVYERF